VCEDECSACRLTGIEASPGSSTPREKNNTLLQRYKKISFTKLAACFRSQAYHPPPPPPPGPGHITKELSFSIPIYYLPGRRTKQSSVFS